MSEEQEFWDDFAAEYAEIQQESQLTIAEDLATFLKTNGILPISSFVDLAAGSGRYIPAIYLIQSVIWPLIFQWKC